ncbi:MAG: hypothetical protein Q9226_001354 [Calogaya cf. arnoldii]
MTIHTASNANNASMTEQTEAQSQLRGLTSLGKLVSVRKGLAGSDVPLADLDQIIGKTIDNVHKDFNAGYLDINSPLLLEKLNGIRADMIAMDYDVTGVNSLLELTITFACGELRIERVPLTGLRTTRFRMDAENLQKLEKLDKLLINIESLLDAGKALEGSNITTLDLDQMISHLTFQLTEMIGIDHEWSIPLVSWTLDGLSHFSNPPKNYVYLVQIKTTNEDIHFMKTATSGRIQWSKPMATSLGGIELEIEIAWCSVSNRIRLYYYSGTLPQALVPDLLDKVFFLELVNRSDCLRVIDKLSTIGKIGRVVLKSRYAFNFRHCIDNCYELTIEYRDEMDVLYAIRPRNRPVVEPPRGRQPNGTKASDLPVREKRCVSVPDDGL